MFKEIVVKMFQQPPQDSEMVEGNGVEDDCDAASDSSICESSESGEIEAHLGPTHNTEQEDKSKLHPHTEGEAQEGHDTVKEVVVKMFQQQRKDPEMVEGNGVDDDHNAALDRSIRESSESGEIEAHHGSTHNIEEADKSKLHPVTEAEAQGHSTLKPIRDSQVIDQHLLSSKSSGRGKKRATTTESYEHKKRRRCKNWIDYETEELVNLKLESLRNEENVGRFGKNKSNEPVWEAISKQIPERTPEQCQNRWDTVVRSYKTIKSHLDGHNKQFSQITVKDFQEMKVSPYFRSSEWYRMFGDQREVWDLSLRNKGRRSLDLNGASIAASLPALHTTGSVNLEEFPPEVASRTSPLVACELTVAACELSLKQCQDMKLAKYEAGVFDKDCLLVILRRSDTKRKVTELCLSSHNEQRSETEGQRVESNYAHIAAVHVQVINPRSLGAFAHCLGVKEVCKQIPRPMKEDGQASFPRAHTPTCTWAACEPRR